MPEPRQVVEEWLDAFEALDMERVMAALADDIVIETESLGEPIRGRDTVRGLLEAGFGAYEAIDVDRRLVVASGGDVAVLLSMRVRFGDDVVVLGETLPTRGKDVRIAGALFASVDDTGRIRRIARVRDTLSLILQLGIPAEQANRLMDRVERRVGERRPRAA